MDFYTTSSIEVHGLVEISQKPTRDANVWTLFRDDVAKRLHLNGEPEVLSVSTVIEAEQSTPTKSTSLTIYSTEKGFNLEIDDVPWI